MRPNRSLSPALTAMALTCLAMGGCGYVPTQKEVDSVDLGKPKTPADLEAMARAEEKRKRKAARRGN